MCGIAGWFSEPPVDRQQAQARLAKMLPLIAHRGPDGHGSVAFDHAGLCHTRLSIIDLESGWQPMKHAELPVYVSFNGEIYNYRDLRQQLISQGAVFRTHSDTEVLLQLYVHYGSDGFRQLRGMYAFALWDEGLQTGYLVRDPLGIKPLFFAQPQGSVCFASEAKAIFALSTEPTVLDEAALHLLLNFRYLPGDYSLFKGIKQLAPGMMLKWRHGGVEMRRLPPIIAETAPEIGAIDALRESVQTHLVADVEVGCYLSGGVDSAAVVKLASERQTIRSFTVNVGDDPDEAKNAARSAQLLNVPNIQGEVPCDLAEQLKRLVWHLEIPKVNALQVSLLARLTAPQVKVALSGLGGDELFYGYNAHRIIYLARQMQQYTPAMMYRFGGSMANRFLDGFSTSVATSWTEPKRAMLMLQRLGDWPMVYGLLRNLWDNRVLRQAIYGERLLAADLPNAFDELKALWPQQHDPLNAMAQFEWRQKMVNDLLWQEDRVSMAEGLEVRTPFVDTHFAAYIQAIGHQRLMPAGRRKAYFYEALREILPDEIVRRPKSGFQIHAVDFFHERLQDLAVDYLSRNMIKKHGLFNERFVHAVLAQPPHKRLRWHYFMLYLMLLTHLWLELFETR